MGEYFEPATPIERDGDIISGADYESLEQIIPGNNYDEIYDDIAERAIKAADQIISADGTEVGLRTLNETLSVEDEPTEITKAYEAFRHQVEKLVDKNIDATVAEYQLDPTGKIRKDYERQEAMIQASINHLKAEEIRKAIHNEKLAEIEKMLYPEERERALAKLLAEEKIAERKRNSRA